MDDERYLLWLSRVTGLGYQKQRLLLSCFGSAKAVHEATGDELLAISGLNLRLVECIRESQNEETIRRYEEELEKKGIRYVSRRGAGYPPGLAQISDPPLILYYIGELPDAGTPAVSVIGARRCTEYGLTAAYGLSKDLGKAGVVVISGMARGIDGMSHKGALDGGGVTVAVLGCGVDICYPIDNKNLRERIIKSGCVVSEYPPGTSPKPGYFPMRNRIISGMSTITVVVEAAERSGTLITVDQALEQGRTVMAVPGPITGGSSRGTNGLLRQGAGIVTSSADIFQELGMDPNILSKEKDGTASADPEGLSREERAVYACFGDDPIEKDGLIRKLDSQAHVVSYVLTMLEMKGLVRKLPGQRYVRK